VGKAKIPETRLAELEQCLKDYYNVQQIDPELLEKAGDIDPS
jgi:hypothetical protein